MQNKGKKKIENLKDVKEDIINKKGKKKIGRPSLEEIAAKAKEEEAILIEGMPGEESFEDMLAFSFNVLAGRLGTHWILDKEEAARGSVLLTNVAKKYFPLIGEYSAEVALLLWLAPVVLLRAQVTIALQTVVDQQKKEDNEKKGQEKEDGK